MSSFTITPFSAEPQTIKAQIKNQISALTTKISNISAREFEEIRNYDNPLRKDIEQSCIELLQKIQTDPSSSPWILQVQKIRTIFLREIYQDLDSLVREVVALDLDSPVSGRDLLFDCKLLSIEGFDPSLDKKELYENFLEIFRNQDAGDLSFNLKIGGDEYVLKGMGIRIDESGNGYLLGSGTFGRVFTACKKGDTEEVAIKLCYASAEKRKRLMREANFLWLLDGCKHVIGAKQVGFMNDVLVVVTEKIRGSDLLDSLNNENIGNFEIAMTLLDAAKGLEELHNIGIVHRDIKPENIMRAEDGSGVIIDFGLSAFQHELVTSFSGTINYASPEMLSRENQGKPSDIYSFGIILANTFYNFEIDVELKSKDIVLPKERFCSFLSPLEAQFSDLIHSCLRRNPEERITAKALVTKWAEICDRMKPFDES